MTAAVAAGLLLALLSAAALNWGFFVQHGAASSLPPLSLRRPLRSLRLLFRDLRWLAGFGAGMGGWALYVAALALAPLSLVQAASAGGIGLLALLVGRTTGSGLTRTERVGVGAAILGLVLLGLSLAGQTTGGASGDPAVVGLWIAVSCAAAALAAGRLPAAVGFGVAAGALYAAGDVATKAAVGGGAVAAVLVVAVLACHGLAFVALQLGFQRGGALSTAGVATLLTNALPILAGTIVFHEGLPGGAPGLLRVAAFVAVVSGAALLGRAGESVPPEPGPALPPIEPAGLQRLGRLRTID